MAGLSDSIGLLFRIQADSGQASAELTKTENAVKNSVTKIQRDLNSISVKNNAGAEISASIQTVAKEFGISTNSITKSISSINPAAGAVASAIAKTFNTSFKAIQSDAVTLESKLKTTFSSFEKVFAKEFTGKSNNLSSLFNIDPQKSGSAKSAFQDFINGFNALPNAEAKADAAIKLFGNDAAKVTEELATVGSGAEKTGLSIASIATGVTIAATAVAALAVAATAVGVELFNVAKSASDFGSEIYDANQKKGLSIPTLQALRFAATQGGISFDQAITPINKFAKTLGDAESGSKKAKETLKLLEVNSYDLNTALSQAYKTILKYPEGTDQMAASQKAFGKSGAELLPFLKEFDGDIQGLIKRASELGLILDEKAIKSADKFGDTLDLIGLQAKTSAARFALEFAPAIVKGMNEISKLLTSNQEIFRQWGTYINNELTNVLEKIKARGGDAKAVGTVIGEEIAKGIGYGITEGTKELGGFLGTRLKEIFTGKDIISPIATGFVTAFWEGVLNAFGTNQKFIDEVKARIIYGFHLGFQSIDDARKQVSSDTPQTGPKRINYGGSSQDQPPAPKKSLADEESRKEAEKLAKENVEGVQQINSENLKENEKRFSAAQEQWKKHYENLKITADIFRQGFLANEKTFTETQKAITAAQFNGKLATEENAVKQQALRLEKQDALENITADSKKRVAEAEKLITDTQKKESEKRVKISEDQAKREIEIDRAKIEKRIAGIEKQGVDERRLESLTVGDIGQAKIDAINDEIKVYKRLLLNAEITGEKRAEIETKIAVLTENAATAKINSAKAVSEATQKETKSQADGAQKAAEAIARTKDEILKVENDLAAFQEEQKRKVLVNTIDSSFGKDKLNALIKLRDFDETENERQRQAELKEAQSAHDIAIKKIKDVEKEKDLVEQINKLLEDRNKIINA